MSLTGGIIIGTGVFSINSSTDSTATGFSTIAAPLAFTSDQRSINVTAVTDTLLISGNISGANGFIKNALGTLVLSGDNSSYTGVTRLATGTLVLDYSANSGRKLGGSAVALRFEGGTVAGASGSLILQGLNAPATVTETASAFDLRFGQYSVLVNGTGTTLAAPTLTRNYNAASANPELGGGVLTFDVGNSTGGMQITGASAANINAVEGVLTTNAGVVRFAKTNATGVLGTLIGTVQNNIGLWAFNNDVEVTGTATGTLSSGLQINSLRYDAASPFTLGTSAGASLMIQSGNVLITSTAGAGAVSLGTASATLASANSQRDLTLNLLNSGTTTLNFSLRSDVGVTKAGPGALVLAGTNFNAGYLTIDEGAVTLNGGKVLGDSSVVNLANRAGVSLTIADGVNETIGGLRGGNTTGGTVTVGAGSTLQINLSTAMTYSGMLAGAAGTTIVKRGSATWTLDTTAHTFAGNLNINQGQITLSNRTVSNLGSVNAITLNTGVLLLDYNSGDDAANKIRDAATITLINTAGVDGLRANDDRNASRVETIGTLALYGGANTVTINKSTGTPTTSQCAFTYAAAAVTRSNQSTLLVRSQNLGDVSGAILATGRLTSVAAFTGADFVGGGATSGTTISIVPWVIGDTSASGTGSSFVTYGANGFRPLTAAEYVALATTSAVATTANDNTSYVQAVSNSGTGLVTGAKLVNSLLVSNTSTTAALTFAGDAAVGTSLTNSSGAFLFLGSATPQGITLNGFNDGIKVGTTTNEYLMYVPNTAAAGVTIGSPLTTSTAKLTKSGAGILNLTAIGSTYTGVTTVNQGTLVIDALDKLGNNGSGGLLLTGGTLKFGAPFDVSSISVTLGVAATADVIQSVGGTFDTAGFSVTLANAIGGGGNGGLTKIGAGTLTLNAATTYTGNTTIQRRNAGLRRFQCTWRRERFAHGRCGDA